MYYQFLLVTHSKRKYEFVRASLIGIKKKLQDN